MKNMEIEKLINEYVNNGSVDVIEELTRRIIFSKLNESDANKLFFTNGIGVGMQQAIIKFGDRKCLIEILLKVNDFALTDFIIKQLGALSVEEAKLFILTDEHMINQEKASEYAYMINKEKTFEYAIKYSDDKTILAYMKKENKVFSGHIKELIMNRLREIKISTAVADELLMLDINEFYIIDVIGAASKTVIIKCLSDMNDRRKYKTKEMLKSFLMRGEISVEEAKAILNDIYIDSEVKLYAIKFASKDTLLEFYFNQENMQIVDACLNRLKEIMTE